MLVSARAFLEEGEQSDVEHYGAVWIGPSFLPHITLSRIKDVNDVATGLAAAQDLTPQSFMAKTIVVGESRERGTIRAVSLERYDLAG